MLRAERSATKLVERVLLYLERRLQAAELRNRRGDSKTYEAAWLLVFECYYGEMPRPLLQAVPSPSGSIPNPNRDKPWFREKYAKPMRRVDRNIEVRVPAHDGYGETTWFDQVLECGHVIEMCFDLPDTERPRHRRCAECAGEGKEADSGSSASRAVAAQRAALPAQQLPIATRYGLASQQIPVSTRGAQAAGVVAMPGRAHRTAAPAHGGGGGPIGVA